MDAEEPTGPPSRASTLVEGLFDAAETGIYLMVAVLLIVAALALVLSLSIFLLRRSGAPQT
jgi:hypothetical protein